MTAVPGPQTLVQDWVRTHRTDMEQAALDALTARPDLSVHDALVLAGLRTAENQIAMIVRLLLGGDLNLVVSGQGERPYKPTPGSVPCPHPGCVRDEHLANPGCHVVHGAWAADRHEDLG